MNETCAVPRGLHHAGCDNRRRCPWGAWVSKGAFVTIDSGDYEIHERDITAMNQLIKRRPIAMAFLMRVGYPAAYRHTGIRPGNSRPSPAPRA